MKDEKDVDLDETLGELGEDKEESFKGMSETHKQDSDQTTRTIKKSIKRKVRK